MVSTAADASTFPIDSSPDVIKIFLKDETRRDLLVMCVEKTMYGDPLHDPQNLSELVKFSSELGYKRTLILVYQLIGITMLYDSIEKDAITKATTKTYFHLPNTTRPLRPASSIKE